ncbi:MAG: 16S rRNA (uracil(1498)-N(3))-methyltransferase [Rhodospirillaceae bacterium]|nr:16S rRNA (uracil(1498)-N(3))-methyltransferase [Rhodospirillaceae bacterium]
MAMTSPPLACRLFVDAPLDAGARIAGAETQSHYLRHVLRLRGGESVALFNGRDGEWRAAVVVLAKHGVAFEVAERLRAQVETPGPWLAFAPIKKARIDLVAEKAAELGVGLLWPVLTRRTAAERVNLARLRANAVEAAEQCGRLSVPEVREATPLAALIDAWPRDRRLFVLDETGAGAPIARALRDVAPPTGAFQCGFLCGPEGGFDKSELDALKELPFVTAVGLGPRILRAETAALAALVCFQAIGGDWR